MRSHILLPIGILLLFYAMFLTPAYFEPADLVISTAYIATWTSMGWPFWLLALWIISGYLALAMSFFFIGHFAFKVKHPIAIGAVIAIIAIAVGYYAIVVNNMIQF